MEAAKLTGQQTIGIQDATMISSLDGGSESTTFDPNFVIAFARLRLAELDSWLSHTQNVMTRASAQTTALNEANEALAEFSQGFTRSANGDADRAKIRDALHAAAGKLPDGDPVKAKLMWIADDNNSLLNANAATNPAGQDSEVSQQDMAQVIQQVQNAGKAIDTQSQTQSLQVNQKLSERSEVLQLAASMIQQMDESAKNILSKIG